MNPRTGAILAMANAPTFDANRFSTAPADERRNRAVTDLYEPGSTFKIVTASAALQEHVMTPDTLIDTSPGYITFGRRTIRDDHMGLGTIPLTEVIAKSSNVGAIKVGMRLGADRLSEYIARFGFGKALAPDFRGDSAGIVWDPDKLDASALASVSMGYQVGVTALQMVTAASPVANGGHLIEPRVVRAFIKGGRRVEVPHKQVDQAISPQVAAEMTEIMEAVVDHGTARSVKIPGYTIAGKTGTSHKLVNGRYSLTEYNASFVGFIPSRHPAIAMIVVIDSPHGPNSYYGATVSAPIWRRIAEAALTYLGVGPNLNPQPPVLMARHETGDTPAVTRVAGPDSMVAARLELVRAGLMPDLRGLSARDAVHLLAKMGMTARMSGDGFVIEQSPEVGAALDRGEPCVLRLDRTPPAAGGTP
jgi:cell division protein FtsI/penicillin-binding protein 2